MRLFSARSGRTARPAGFAWNMAKTLAQMLIMWAIFFGLLPAGIYYFEDKVGLADYRFGSATWQIVGATLFLLGYALAQTSAVYMVREGHGTPLPADCPRDLVIAGPYRYVRNPMAIGSFAQGVAVGLWLGSPLVVTYAFVGAVGWNYFVRPWEEMDLQRRFGEAYARYRDSVRCWLPNVKPYTA
jgi:protein-S-isoprenylcysteine O-methyltransferase Ste14